MGALQGNPGPSYASRAFLALGGQSMTNYARMYRFGITPWERYATAAAASISALLDREESERSRPSAVRSTSAAAVVPAAPTGLERHCPNLPRSGQRPTMPRTAHSCRIERVADKHASA